MLKLTNVENKVELNLVVTGYEFPNSPKDDWCLVQAIVTQENKKFEVVFPALETTDIARIHEWFKRLSEHKLPRFANLSFTEPCIEFSFLAYKDDTVRISINLSREMKPDYELKQFGWSLSEWNIVFELNSKDFREIIKNIESVIKQYSARGKS